MEHDIKFKKRLVFELDQVTYYKFAELAKLKGFKSVQEMMKKSFNDEWFQAQLEKVKTA